jgi:DNA-binding transcriptional MerR regulator
MYTVKQLAGLAGVSVRTLHYYDEIGLLQPSAVAANGYRQYDEAALLRLQQILFYRELDFSLQEIQQIIGRPDFDVLRALEEHRRELHKRAGRLKRLIQTINHTLLHLKGEIAMSNGELFEGFNEAKQKEYEAEARQRWGDDEVDASTKKWSAYSEAQKKQILAEGEAIRRDLAAAMPAGHDSPEVQAVVARWAKHLEYFYVPSIERLRGLGHLYVEDDRFAANYRKYHADLPEFFQRAIEVYCDEREE